MLTAESERDVGADRDDQTSSVARARAELLATVAHRRLIGVLLRLDVAGRIPFRQDVILASVEPGTAQLTQEIRWAA